MLVSLSHRPARSRIALTLLAAASSTCEENKEPETAFTCKNTLTCTPHACHMHITPAPRLAVSGSKPPME